MFTHLHLHSDYSLLDGLARIPQIVARVRELGQEAVALTDHGVLYGAIEFYKECRRQGVKPIIGVEGYVARRSRRDRDPQDKQPHHLTLLARTDQGYRNLLALITKANLEGYYYKPRLDRELLQQYGQGIIALSGCQSGEIARLLLDGRDEEAAAAARFYQDVFDDFYIEIQEHGNLPELQLLNPRLVALSQRTGIPLAATNDSHYVLQEEASLHDVLLCIGTNATIHDEKRMRMSDDSYCIKSEAEMRAAFADLPEAVDNTWRIAEKCAVTLEFGRLHLPEAEVPAGLSPDDYLARLCLEALPQVYPDTGDAVRQRLDYELSVVRQTGFANYILVVRDFALFARGCGIAMGVRGSAAASIILYLLGITDIDPLQYRLVFERFLNVERREMPDIDMDFADDRRDEVIRYVAAKYGHDRVAQIITFGTMGAKASIRDVGRALGISYGQVDRLVRLIPTVPPSVHMNIDLALEMNQQLSQLCRDDPQIQQLVETARSLEGVARHASTHAAGVVISREPLVEHLPLQRPVRGDENGIPMTQYPMEGVADLGLLKMDFLGLGNLTILSRAVENIRQARNLELDLKGLPDGDPKTYAMLSAGETFGVFQLESAGMRRHIQELKPSGIPDLAAMVALYRPGPMQHVTTYIRAKHGLAAIRYPHPDLADVLDETYGVIVYQDQVLLIAQKFAGYSLGQADVMRKAMGKKIPEVMRAERERFIGGAGAKGYSPDEAQAVFDLIEPFAGYAFNKAHAVCYATIAYQTAYLKANYPAEYMAAVLTQAQEHPDGMERVGAAVAECARLGVRVLPPDANSSEVSFAVERQPNGDLAVRFGLATIKNVRHAAAEAIVAARCEGGPFTAVEELCRRLDFGRLNKRALESLVKAGALDSLAPRGALLANLDRLASLAQREQRLRKSGQATMFDLFGEQVSVTLPSLDLQEETKLSRGQMLSWEKELLGAYVSEHPASRAASDRRVTALCGEIGEEMAGREVTLAGIVTSTRQLYTREGRPFLAAVIEDLSGSEEVTAWPDLYAQTRDLWEPGNILLLDVRVRVRGGRLNVSVQNVELYEESPALAEPSSDGAIGEPPPQYAPAQRNGAASPAARPPPPEAAVPPPVTAPPRRLVITIRETDDEEDDRQRLAAVVDVLAQFPGEDEVNLTVVSDGTAETLALPSARACPDLAQRIAEALGEGGKAGIEEGIVEARAD